MDEQHHRPSVPIEESRGVDVAPAKHDRMLTNVQRLLRAVKTKASADVVPQPYGNRRSASKGVVCVGCTDRVVVDLVGRESEVLKFRVGMDFGDNRVDLDFSPIQTPSPVTAFLAEGTIWTPNR